MYLHLGQNVVVPESSVVGVFDLDNTTSSHITRKFLGDAEKAGHVINVSDDLPKSFVVCCAEKSYRTTERRRDSDVVKKDNELTVYLSQLSSQTLMKRYETMKLI